MLNKKAQGLSLNVIIVAAIALLVLVVLSLIFTGRLGTTRKAFDSCEENRGTCVLGDTCPESKTRSGAYKCDQDGDGEYNEGPYVDGICCIGV